MKKKEFISKYDESNFAGRAATYLVETITHQREDGQWFVGGFQVVPKKAEEPVEITVEFRVENTATGTFNYMFIASGKGIKAEAEDLVGIFEKLAKVADPL